MGFEEDFKEMREKIDKMLRSFFKGKPSNLKSPFVYGFSVRVGKDGIPKIREFGTMKPTVERRDPIEREPVYDVIEGDEQIFITVDLPGATPEKIRLRASERVITIEAQGYRRYWKVLDMPERVDASSLSWTFNNGVLDISMNKRTRSLTSTSSGKF
ncbi:MAG: Hsp20/alpha crystallin family protein [Candidatus Thermoplasmatota archaeon]|nr:Hsp20/alpha crystallin family protein [Candidatus Thermoplasmatota archaeon]